MRKPRNADRSPDIPGWLVGGAGRADRCATPQSVTDSAGRAVPVPAQVTRVFPAGPPAAITLYTIAPDLLLGWPRANRADEREFLDEKIGARPEVGRITGRGNTANLEVVLALKPDLILDIGIVNNTYISLAERVQQQTGIPYALLDGRFDGIAGTYRTIGALTGRRDAGEAAARYAEETVKTITSRLPPPEKRPRIYYARGPRGLETGLGGSINVETIELLGAQRRGRHARRPRHRIDRGRAGVESRGDRHHRQGFRGERLQSCRPGGRLRRFAQNASTCRRSCRSAGSISRRRSTG